MFDLCVDSASMRHSSITSNLRRIILLTDTGGRDEEGTL